MTQKTEGLRERLRDALIDVPGRCLNPDAPLGDQVDVPAIDDLVEAALVALGLDDLDAAVERVARVICTHGYGNDPKLYEEEAHEALAALFATDGGGLGDSTP